MCPGHRSLGPENKGDRQQESASPSLFKQDNDADWSLLPPPNLVCSQLLSKQEGQEELTIPGAENTMVPLQSLPSRLSLVGDREPFTHFTRKLASVVLGPQTVAEEWESKKTKQTWLCGRASHVTTSALFPPPPCLPHCYQNVKKAYYFHCQGQCLLLPI